MSCDVYYSLRRLQIGALLCDVYKRERPACSPTRNEVKHGDHLLIKRDPESKQRTTYSEGRSSLDGPAPLAGVTGQAEVRGERSHQSGNHRDSNYAPHPEFKSVTYADIPPLSEDRLSLGDDQHTAGEGFLHHV